MHRSLPFVFLMFVWLSGRSQVYQDANDQPHTHSTEIGFMGICDNHITNAASDHLKASMDRVTGELTLQVDLRSVHYTSGDTSSGPFTSLPLPQFIFRGQPVRKTDAPISFQSGSYLMSGNLEINGISAPTTIYVNLSSGPSDTLYLSVDFDFALNTFHLEKLIKDCYNYYHVEIPEAILRPDL
ncbi:MAG: hypothetical protein KDD36_07795 [Flavobacteriales bacterium]|nr:hypothetical protein [Flavobacteriales bacterium]